MFNLAILFDLSLLLASFSNSNLQTDVDETDKSTRQAQTPILADKCPQNYVQEGFRGRRHLNSTSYALWNCSNRSYVYSRHRIRRRGHGKLVLRPYSAKLTTQQRVVLLIGVGILTHVPAKVMACRVRQRSQSCHLPSPMRGVGGS